MILEGVIKVLKGEAWEDDFDLSAKGFKTSFCAVAAYFPFYFIVLQSVVKYNAVNGDVPYLAVAIILALMTLSFPIIAYILCMAFDKGAEFRPWVIVRNWTMLFVFILMSTGFGLNLIGLVPFSVAYIVGLSLYLSTLAVDIRVANIVVGFDWILAVFAGILITVFAMIVLLMGLTQTL